MLTNITRRNYYGKANEEYAEFLKSEYDNIASAHFSAVSAISTFFKHYLFFIGLPIPIGLIFFKVVDIENLAGHIEEIKLGIGLLGVAISIVGFLVMCYLSNLRFDAVLYAQKVNSIRRFFSDRSGLRLHQLLEISHLPCSKAKPSYKEPLYFGWVVFTLALINSCYFFIGLFFSISSEICFSYPFVSYDIQFNVPFEWLWAFAASIIFFVAHWFMYCYLCKYRDTRFFRTRIIGVDIDGVLNRHREHFCAILKDKTGKEINPDDITEVPVRNCVSLGLSEKDELSVFHDLRYWKEMPADEKAIKYLEKIRKEFGFHIHLFSYRPWPIKGWPKIAIDKKAWRKITWRWWWPGVAISKITKCWLKEKSFSKHKDFQLEKAHVHVTSSRLNNLTRNRYLLTKARKIEIFVEDTLENAIKLSQFCNIVFLIDHPYNQTLELPYNVVRVADWNEIYEFLKIVG